MQKTLLIVMLMVFSFHSFAQSKKKDRQEEKRAQINEMVRLEEEGVITHQKSIAVGLKLTTDGYGAFFEIGRASSVKRALLFQLDISERKHVKEEKIGSMYSQSIPYVYGKINSFYPVKLGVQQQILLGNKSNKNGVGVTGNIGGGASLALLRPYYVQVSRGNALDYIKYNSPDSLDFLGSNIFGGPSLSKGWNEMIVTPGVYAKAALRFDYGIFNEIVSAIEVGINGEYYTKKIPQMAYNEEKKFFYGAYFSLIFGKRK
ncbi:MAG: hypothetical protein ABIN48_04320 [Ginsengibacter sp.]